MSARSLPHKVDNTASTRHVATADDLCPSDVSDSNVKDKCVTDAGMGESVTTENSRELEVEPSERSTQVQSDEAAVNGNKSSDTSNELTDTRCETTEGVESTMDAASWDVPSDGGIYFPPIHSKDRCIHCGKQRPPEQCPVCHRMFRSVAVHIGRHSVRRTHTPSLLLDVQPTPEEDTVSDLTGEPSTSKVGSARFDRSHICADCGAVFASAKTLRAHAKSCPKVAICMVCGASCNSAASLQVHMELHGDSDEVGNEDRDENMLLQEDFTCAVCDEEFGSLELLSEHMEDHVGD